MTNVTKLNLLLTKLQITKKIMMKLLFIEAISKSKFPIQALWLVSSLLSTAGGSMETPAPQATIKPFLRPAWIVLFPFRCQQPLGISDLANKTGSWGRVLWSRKEADGIESPVRLYRLGHAWLIYTKWIHIRAVNAQGKDSLRCMCCVIEMWFPSSGSIRGRQEEGTQRDKEANQRRGWQEARAD